ncbi:MAG: hypothetical protein P8X68_20035 [Desulfobacterales bacterium]|jgi:hypothetical protein
MKNIALLTSLAMLLIGLISPAKALAQDKSCQFEPTGSDDVYLTIREKVDPGETREVVTWEGWVKRDEQKQYTSQTGQVSYDYRLSSGDRTYGDNFSSCKDGQIIGIP